MPEMTRKEKIEYLQERLPDRDFSVFQKASDEVIDCYVLIEQSRELKGVI